MLTMTKVLHKKSSSIRSDSMGGGAHGDRHGKVTNLDSLTYVTDESDVWRASIASQHYQHRGIFWNIGKHQTLMAYVLIALIGMVQACVAYFANMMTSSFVSVSLLLDALIHYHFYSHS
jgi:hypothetical protein